MLFSTQSAERPEAQKPQAWFLSPHTPLPGMHLPAPTCPIPSSPPCSLLSPARVLPQALQTLSQREEVGLLTTAKVQDGFSQQGPKLKTRATPNLQTVSGQARVGSCGQVCGNWL